MKQQQPLKSRALPYALRNSLAGQLLLMLSFVFFMLGSLPAQTISFSNTNLNGESSNNPTSLDFGPDGRLYVAQQDGTIKAYSVERDNAAPGSGSYSVTATETINLIKTGVPNHNDDGATNSTSQRQVTGLLALGTAANPVLYVTSSDWRIAVGNDTGLDTNSGVISRLTWNGSAWIKVDIVRGLSRCEENHAINGLDIDPNTNTLYVMVGGNANKGAPGNNFSGTPEYYTSAALISVDLDEIDQIIANNGGQPFTDLRTNTAFVYDLPTLNDPDPNRADITNTSPLFPYQSSHPLYNATIDVGDPFGGNNGSNQAITEPGGPVQIHSGGYRNAYDIVFTENGRLYSSDNGPNTGWGGLPLEYDENDNLVGDVGASLDPDHYITNEFNESGSNGHGDVLHFINPDPDLQQAGMETVPYYGGHPTPIRAFPKKSRIIIYEEQGNGNWVATANYDFEDLLVGVTGYYNPTLDITDYPDKRLEGVYSANVMSTYGRIDIVNSSTNGICEYTAENNFGGAMKGNILTASFNGNINRYEMNAAGDAAVVEETGFLSGFGNQPLDVIAQGDNDPFPGTIWAATYGADNITIFEPADFGDCPQPGDPEYDDPFVDSDNDGYNNADEVANGTNICSGGSVPADNDGDFISDLLDDDDDNDGILDINDPFAIDATNGMNTSLPIFYPFWNNDPGTGFAGLGFTGWMINNSTDYLDQFIPDNVDFGGAAGKASIVEVSAGDAFQGGDSQDNGFQFGLNNTSQPFTVHTKLESPFFADPLTGNAQTPADFQSWGIQVGPGDQDNYLKVVFNANGGAGGIEVLKEENGNTTAATYGPGVVGNLLGAGSVDIYISCFPANNTIQPYASIDQGLTIVPLGSPIVVPASWLDPTDNQAIAIGLISTSTGASPFTAIWDFINVTAENSNANLLAENAPLDFGEIVEGSGAVSQQLRVLNEGGPSAGSVEITSVGFSGTDAGEFAFTGSLPIEIGPGNVADLDIEFTPGAIGVKDANVVITHDGDNSPYIVPISAEVLEESLVLYRVNAGGAAQATLDGPNPGWEVDTQNNPSSYRNSGSNVANTSANNFDPSVPAYVPAGIWSQERWDPGAAPEMEWDFPATVAGNYTVNLFFLSNCDCTDEVDERIFDVIIEGTTVLDDYDIVADVGHKTAVMKTFTVSVTDGNLDIDFGHVVENPLINGIEILGPGSGGFGPLVLEPIDNQTSFEEDVIQGPTASASGGDPLENVTYSIAGQPAGIDIEETNGQIFGTIAAGAAANSPYTVTVTADKPSSDPVQTSFTWTVLPPSEGTALFRVNCGGPEVADTELNWLADQSASMANGNAQTGTPSPYLNLSGAAEDITFGGSYTGGMLNDYPNALFSTERYSTVAGTTDNMQWDFPVPAGTYQVNLLFAEIWSGAVNPGVRVFTIEVEDQTTTDFDATAEFDHQTAGVKSYTVQVTDGNLDINFIQQLQNPAIKAIEVRSIDQPTSTAMASIGVLAGGGNINASTFGNNSFSITNDSPDGQDITSVTFDLNTNMLPEMVLDPDGTAGDMTPKPFTVGDNGTSGTITHTLGSPYGTGGFRSLTIEFSDFNPGETMTFAIDVDPTSIEGLSAPGPNDAGSVSGLEMVGTSVTVDFDDNSSFTNNLYSDGSNAGAVTKLRDGIPTAPTLAVQGGSSPATVGDANQTLLLSGGPPSGEVSLLQVEAGFFEDGGNLNQMPFEVNSAVNVTRTIDIVLDGSGSAQIPVLLTDSDAEAGYNYFIATVEDGSDFGLTSNVIILEYDANQQSTAAMSGSLTTNACEGTNLTFTFYEAGTATMAHQATTSLGAAGAFSLNDIPPGTYDVMVKLDNSLSEMSPTIHVFTAGQNTAVNDFDPPRMGDANNNNIINIVDFAALSTSYGLSSGDAGFIPEVDFNCNGLINIVDFANLSTNYGQSGDQPNGN